MENPWEPKSGDVLENKLSLPPPLETTLVTLRASSRVQRKATSERKNEALLQIAKAMKTQESEILKANAVDLKNLDPSTNNAFKDRLTLNPKRIDGMILTLQQVAALEDPVGEIVEQRTLPNGLDLKRVRSPLGVIFMVFESRPNVIIEAFSLAFKSGNTIILRGGSESAATAAVIYKIMRDCFKNLGWVDLPFLGIEDYDRKIVETLLQRKDLVDIAVPRGGDKLIDFVQRTALMPIIKNDRGMCHAYVDEEADLEMAAKIVANGKCQRPGVCNSLETVLVHRKIAAQFLPILYKQTQASNLIWKTDPEADKILNSEKNIEAVSPSDWDTEHLDLILNCKVISGIDEALMHIEKHGSKHSETIITRNEVKARRFQEDVDAAVVYWNASTRFTDGFEFGLGGELGISTQKIHVRGPVGLRELTTPRWIVDGSGQVRE